MSLHWKGLFAGLCLLAGVSLAAPATLAQTDGAGSLYLPLLVKEVTGVSSIQLVEQARKAGTITDEQALVYKVQAVVGDPALPQQYRGDDAYLDGTLVINEAVTKLDEVSPQTRAILEPYLRAPSDPTSWLAQHEPGPGGARAAGAAALTWETLVTADDKVKVWYHPELSGHAARAQKLAAELQRHIWPTLTKQFREPKPDCGAACPEGGGDPRVDIYMAQIDRSYVQGTPVSKTAGVSSYLVIRPNISFGILAHELMHMVQFAYPMASSSEYDWIMESTAQWAIHFVYPTDNQDPDYPKRNEEQAVLLDYLDAPDAELELTNDAHEYGSYLFWFHHRSADMVKKVLETMTMANSLANVNAAVAGGFETDWPIFALYNWNQPPVDDYHEWDELVDIPSAYYRSYEADSEDTFAIEVKHLAAQYHSFEFTGEETRRVRIELPAALHGVEGAHVWAILKIDGEWKEPEDWTTESEKTFCRDNPGENVEEIVLIISNSTWQDRTHVLDPGEGKVSTSRSCGCQDANTFQEWTGSASMSYSKTANEDQTNVEVSRQASLSFRLTREPDTFDGNYRWEGDPLAGSTASVNDRLDDGGMPFTWIGNKIVPDTRRIRLEIDPANCTYEVWVGVFVDTTYNYGSGEWQEQEEMEFRLYDEPVPVNTEDWKLSGGESVPVILGVASEEVDRWFGSGGAMGQLKNILGEQLGSAPVSWSFTPVEPDAE